MVFHPPILLYYLPFTNYLVYSVVSYIKEALREESWDSEALPTLCKIDEAQLRELLKHCAAKRCSLYSDCEGPLYVLEEIAEVYFKKQR